MVKCLLFSAAFGLFLFSGSIFLYVVNGQLTVLSVLLMGVYRWGLGALVLCKWNELSDYGFLELFMRSLCWNCNHVAFYVS